MHPLPIIHRGFDRSWKRLGHRDQKDVDVAVMKFRRDPNAPGLNLKPLSGARDRRIHTIRANRDVRIVLALDGPRTAFLLVGHHDEAIGWAVKQRLAVNPRTGTLQIYEAAEDQPAYPAPPPKVVEPVMELAEEPSPPPVPAPEPLFASVDDDRLLALGLPRDWLPAIRRLVEPQQVEPLEDKLPEEAWLALMDLATGGSPEPSAPLAEDADPWTDGDARRRFRVVRDEEELARALERDWPDWAVWLHPDQRAAVERDWTGPARVSGGPGTGKSVVLMHRAARRARAGASVLLTTWSAPLATRLAEGVRLLLDGDGDAGARVRVIHLHGLAAEILRGAGRPADAVSDADLASLIAAAATGLAHRFALAFVEEEWRAIVDFWGVRRQESWLSQPRTGRRDPLGPEDRLALWDVFAEVRSGLEARGLATWSDLCDAAAEQVARAGTPLFDDVLVDEAQDFGPRELSFVAELSARGGPGLFLAGDVGQTIYRWPFAWSRVGVDVRGRARRLRVNYRTAGRLRRWADGLLPEGLPALGEEAPETRGDVCLFDGPEDPEIVDCATPEEEARAVHAWLERRLAAGVPANEIAVIAPDRRRADAAVRPTSAALGLATRRLGDGPGDGLWVDAMSGAKGLEFRAVAMIGADMPYPADERRRALLHMSATRARDSLLVTRAAPADQVV